jgi:hypothetical protein
MKRILLAPILGGLILFVWMFVAHEVLGLGEVGVGEIPNEAVVLSAMRGAIPEAGFYIFPGFGLGPKPTGEQRKAAMPESEGRCSVCGRAVCWKERKSPADLR